MVDKRMTLYLNETDRRNMAGLNAQLAAQGAPVLGPNGQPSLSALVRYLVSNELDRQHAQNGKVK